MAANIASFRDYFANVVDPYGNADGLLNAFAATDNNITPAIAYGSANSSRYPLYFLGSHNDQRPRLMGVPFTPPLLPGAGGVANKYALDGDLSVAGQLPNIVLLPQTSFHLVQGNDVPPNDEMEAAWAANPNVPL